MTFKEISPFDLNLNPFNAIGNEWMLITAGTIEKCNTMTASWGQLGIMWNKPVANCFIRPQRYTREFVDNSDYFTLSFFDTAIYRGALNLLGTKSGRDGDKIKEAGLSIKAFDGQPAFAEARLVLVCKKLYQHDLQGAGFIETEIDEHHYEDADYHRMFMGEIVKAYIAQ